MVSIHYNSSSNFIPLGTSVTFNCVNFESNLPFLHSFKVTVHGSEKPVLTLSDMIVDDLKEKNIFIESKNDTLTVLATMANNQTVVECNDGGFDPAHFSDPIEIIVIGRW